MLPIEFNPIKGISIRKVSLPGDTDILKEIIFKDHSPSSASESEDEAIKAIYEPLLKDPDISIYLLGLKKKTLFVAEIFTPLLNTYEYSPKKAIDYVLEIRLNIDPADEPHALKALRTLTAGFFAIYHIARVIVPVSPGRSNDLLLAILKKARFEKIKDRTGEEPNMIYAREQALYTN